MPLLAAIEQRRAYRAIGSQTIEKDVLERLLEAAHSAPSSANNQPWRLVTVTEAEQLAALKETLSKGNYWAQDAPAITAFVTHPDWSMRIGGRDLAFFELGMAAMAYQIQAVAEGLYVHPIVGFDANKAKEVLGIDDEFVLEILMVTGHPGDVNTLNEKHLASERSARIRKPLESVATYDRWNDSLFPENKS